MFLDSQCKIKLFSTKVGVENVTKVIENVAVQQKESTLI